METQGGTTPFSGVLFIPETAGLTTPGSYSCTIYVSGRTGGMNGPVVATTTISATLVVSAPALPTLTGVACSIASLSSGQSTSCSVSLSAAAPSGGVVVTLLSNTSLLTVPASVTVTAGSTSASFLATAGTISTAGSATITASYNGSSPSSTIQLSAPALPTVTGVACSPTSLNSGQSASCSVSLSAAAPNVGAVVTLSSNNSLLTVPASVTVAAGFTTSASFTVTAGTIAGSVIITASYNSTSQSLSISIGTNVLTVSPTSLSFSPQQGDAPQSISVFATTAGAFTVSASSDANWLTVSPVSGQTPGVVGVSVNPSGVSPGRHSGSVTITGANTAPPSITVPVTLTVPPPQPQLSVNPGFVNVSVVAGSAAQQGQLIVSNTGGGTLSWTAAQSGTAASWLSVSGSGKATPTSPGTASFTVNPAGLATETYTANIEVSAGGSPSQTVPVTLVVSAQSETIVLPQSGLEFDAVAEGPAPASQQFVVLGATNWTASVCTFSSTSDTCAPANGSWLQATPANGNSVTVSVNPLGLAADDYFGSVQIAAAGASNSPQVVTVLLHVLPAGQVPPPAAPSGAVFVGTAGAANPAAQSYTLTNAGAGTLTYNSTVSTPSWLALSPASGTIAAFSGAPVSLNVNTAGLAAGVQLGTVRVAFSDGSIREISVALVLVASSSSQAAPAIATPHGSGNCSALTVTPYGTSPPNLSNNYTVQVGAQPSVSVQVTDCNGNPVTTANGGAVSGTVSPGGPFNLSDEGNGVWQGGWTVGNTPGAATVTVNAVVFSVESNAIGFQSFAVTIVPNSNTQVAQPAAVLNAASYPVTQNGQSQNNVTPGSLAAIFGSQLADQPQSATAPFPLTLDHVTVTLGGQSLLLYYVSPGQVNALIPWELNASSNQLSVVRDGTQSNPLAVTVVNAQPAIFTTNQKGSGQGAILIANTATIAGSGGQPVPRGGYIEIFCTGLGAVSHTPAEGAPAPSKPPYATTLLEPTVSLGGVNAPVSFSGLAPGFVGLYQVNALVPDDAPTGSAVPIVITIGNIQSPAGVTIAVQ
jgi:uncharacterized protein (TIGR03437 family)